MNNLRVYAKRLGSDEKLQGTGINIFEGNAILYDRYASYEVEPESVLLRANVEMEKYDKPTTTNSVAHKLHEKLVQTVIDFMNENNIDDVLFVNSLTLLTSSYQVGKIRAIIE